MHGKIIGCGIFAFLLFLCFQIGGCVGGYEGIDYSEGFRDGKIQKMSLKGLIWKTHECELSMDGIKTVQRETKEVTSVFEFTIRDPRLVELVKNIPPNTRVRVFYKEKMFASSLITDTGYFATDVKILDKDEQ